MQHLSSKKCEHLLHVSEIFDGQCHQSEGDRALLASVEVKQHMKQWALIGSVMRRELPQRFDPDFSDKVMARIDEESSAFEHKDAAAWVPPCGDEELPSMLKSREAFRRAVAESEHKEFDQAELNAPEQVKAVQNVVAKAAKQRTNMPFFSFKRIGILVAQTAIAASVAVVAVVGMQTYNAADPVMENPVSVNALSNVGPVSGLSLTSYQNADSDLMMNPELMPDINSSDVRGNGNNQAEVREQQKKELERINMYVRGYIMETAAN